MIYLAAALAPSFLSVFQVESSFPSPNSMLATVHPENDVRLEPIRIVSIEKPRLPARWSANCCESECYNSRHAVQPVSSAVVGVVILHVRGLGRLRDSLRC